MNENTWGARGNTPLSVWGPGEATDQPAGTNDLTTMVAGAFATNTHIRRDLVEHPPGGGIQFQTTEITSEGVVYQNNGVKVTAFLVDHGVVKPAFGYRVDYQGHSVVFSGDTTYTPNLVKNAQGADVLVHEVLLSPPNATPANDAILSYHSTPEQAANTFSQVAPKLAVYTHIVDQTGAGTQGIINRTRAAGYSGPLWVGQGPGFDRDRRRGPAMSILVEPVHCGHHGWELPEQSHRRRERDCVGRKLRHRREFRVFLAGERRFVRDSKRE